MSPRVLWPQTYWQDDLKPERDGLGAGVEPVFSARIANVTDEQWRTCDGIVGAQPPADKLDVIERCRIYVKLGVGYDDIDLKGLGERGIPVCNVPDYGTREVADHAIALMLTLTKAIAFHDENLRADPKANWRPALNPFGQRMSDCTFGVVGIGGSARPRPCAPRRSTWTSSSTTPTSRAASSWPWACAAPTAWPS